MTTAKNVMPYSPIRLQRIVAGPTKPTNSKSNADELAIPRHEITMPPDMECFQSVFSSFGGDDDVDFLFMGPDAGFDEDADAGASPEFIEEIDVDDAIGAEDGIDYSCLDLETVDLDGAIAIKLDDIDEKQLMGPPPAFPSALPPRPWSTASMPVTGAAPPSAAVPFHPLREPSAARVSGSICGADVGAMRGGGSAGAGQERVEGAADGARAQIAAGSVDFVAKALKKDLSHARSDVNACHLVECLVKEYPQALADPEQN